ncbi:19727_t:CDS:2 [Gigaspora rosea]|nr:19727_t:CDS:2 [Gigaspora rosea]
MTSLLHNTTTNVETKSVDNQIKTVPLANAPAPMIVIIPTSSSPNPPQFTNSEIDHNPWTRATWFEADDTRQSEKMETKSNKTIEANPIDTASPRILYSQTQMST